MGYVWDMFASERGRAGAARFARASSLPCTVSGALRALPPFSLLSFPLLPFQPSCRSCGGLARSCCAGEGRPGRGWRGCRSAPDVADPVRAASRRRLRRWRGRVPGPWAAALSPQVEQRRPGEPRRRPGHEGLRRGARPGWFERRSAGGRRRGPVPHRQAAGPPPGERRRRPSGCSKCRRRSRRAT